jgi:hypothetical protein
MAMKKGKLSAAALKPSENMLNLASNMKASATDEVVKDSRKKFIKSNLSNMSFEKTDKNETTEHFFKVNYHYIYFFKVNYHYSN